MRGKKRKPTEEEIVEWLTPWGPAVTKEALIAAIKEKNKYHWWRLNYDYRWLQRQLKKMGYNPEEAKDLL